MPKAQSPVFIPGWILALFATALVACDNGGGGGGSGGGAVANECFDYSNFKGETPAVTFKADVLPILRGSCGLSSACHGDTKPSAPAQHYFGPSGTTGEATPAQLAAIFDQSVGKPSVAEPAMNVVAPSHPEESFLMYKLDGVNCDKLACAGDKTCGSSMPQGGARLPKEERDTIRRWIAQGAKND